MRTGVGRVTGWRLGLLAGMLFSAPGWADTKAGVDAWQRGDYRTAVIEWRKAADAGDTDAQFNLGQAYKLGRGVPMDTALAEQWFGRAAAKGHEQAEDSYGLALFQNGHARQAVPYLEKSSARGEPRAEYILGTMLFNGADIKKDWVRAYALTSRAAQAGLPQATQSLAQMDGYLSAGERQQGLSLAQSMGAGTSAAPPPRELAGTAGGGMQASAPPPSQLAENGPPTPPPYGSPPRTNRDNEPNDTASAPPSPVYVPSPAAGDYEGKASRPGPVKAPSKVAARPAPPVKTPAVKAPPVKSPAVAKPSGRWQLQLGAFGDPANARRLGSQLAGRFRGRSVSYPKARALTKVLVGPFASRAEAVAACGSAKPCVPIEP